MKNRLEIITEAVSRALKDGTLSPGRPLNVPQKEALKGYLAFLSSPNSPEDLSRAYVDMATGTGKTGLFAVITRYAHLVAQERGQGEHFKTIIVEPTTLLLEQTRDELATVIPELKEDIGIYGGGSKELGQPITIMTYDAWVELFESGQMRAEDIGLHITDEAHYGLSVRRQQLMNDRMANTVHFGVTATAEYDQEKTLELTHRNMVYHIGINEAIEQGFLSEYAHVQYAIMRVVPSLTDPARTDIDNKEKLVFKKQEWSRMVVSTYATMEDGISGQPLSDKIAIFFAADTRHADDLAEELNKNDDLQKKARANGFDGVAISVHSVGHSSAEQNRRLEAFKQGRYMAVVGDQKFKEGFNFPRVKFIASYPGNSLVDTVQKLGRAMRSWTAPHTSTPQGTVILEAIPYIGDTEPVLDKRSRSFAMAHCITAYDILKGTTVLAPGREVRPSQKTSGHRERLLSPTCTVEVFTTDEETLTISQQIDGARAIDRTPLTEEMIAELKNKIAEHGGWGADWLAKAVAQYERDNNLQDSGLTDGKIVTLINGQLKTFDAEQWKRLNDTLDSIPKSSLNLKLRHAGSGSGKVWTVDKTEKTLLFEKQDSISQNERTRFFWAMMLMNLGADITTNRASLFSPLRPSEGYLVSAFAQVYLAYWKAAQPKNISYRSGLPTDLIIDNYPEMGELFDAYAKAVMRRGKRNDTRLALGTKAIQSGMKFLEDFRSSYSLEIFKALEEEWIQKIKTPVDQAIMQTVDAEWGAASGLQDPMANSTSLVVPSPP